MRKAMRRTTCVSMRTTAGRTMGRMPRVLAATLWLTLGSGLSGCAIQLGGGQSKTVVEASVGEELKDLKAAHDAGAITASEYEALKKAILER